MCNKKLFQLTKHKELWNFLAENPTARKEDWDGWKKYGDWDEEAGISNILNKCYACAYATAHNNDMCPFAIKKLCWYDIVACVNGLYYKWCMEPDQEARSALAREIRDFPVREGIPTE